MESVCGLENRLSTAWFVLTSRRYCTFIGYDPEECFKAVSLSFLHYFFDWLLSQKTGKDGRKKRGTKKSSSLGTYWKVYRLVYERARNEKLDAKLNRKMHRVGSSQASTERPG